ncbi:NAD-dependent epimerase/dehydratase family protein [Streptomyces sp. NPDC098781]|uniref:NAD-dependent epimerase/dehydratase family protein n=1 Tax=Streptomyces sp. NPDC098781 TaxID=3366097 RepID=UPI0037F687D5
MKALVIGATGYVGSRIAGDLSAHGYETFGLARSAKAAETLRKAGIKPVLGDANRLGELSGLIADFGIVVFTAMVPFDDETEIMRQLVSCLRTGQNLIFISGSGVVSLDARDGAWNDNTFAEDAAFPFPALPTRRIRLGTEQLVRDSAERGLRAFVIRPPLIWGHGASIQIPQFFESARLTGAVCYLGQGLNLYSHVHVDDVATVTRLAVQRGTPGAVYHAVAGEVNFKTIAEAVATVVGCPTRSLDYEEACELWGAPWVDMGLAVNSRIRGPRARKDLGFAPRHVDLVEDIRSGSYFTAYTEGGRNAQAYSWSGHG